MRLDRTRFTVALTTFAAAGFFAVLLAASDSAVALERARDGGLEGGSRGFVLTSDPPDPPPMRERSQWILDLRWSKGEVFLLGVHKIENPAPVETPRAMGRFVLELFEGPTLIERVRFDFPLLGDEPQDGGLRPIPYFGQNLTTRIGVMFPATKRGTKLELRDRSTDQRWRLPWPLPEPRDSGAAEAGASGADGGRQ